MVRKLRKATRDAENREEKAVKWRKWREKWADRFRALGRKIRWAFPDKKYMASLYPELEHRVYLLPFYWIKRDFHLLLVLFRAEKRTEETGIPAKTAEEAETKKQEEIAGQYSAFRSFRGGRENAITDIGYQDDPFRTNGRKKVFYKERQKEEKKEFASQITEEEKKEFTDKLTAGERNSTENIQHIRKEIFEEKEAEEEELLPLNKDFAFLSEEIDENEKTDEAEEEKESEWNLWDFSAPRTSVPEYDSLRRQVSKGAKYACGAFRKRRCSDTDGGRASGKCEGGRSALQGKAGGRKKSISRGGRRRALLPRKRGKESFRTAVEKRKAGRRDFGEKAKT